MDYTFFYHLLWILFIGMFLGGIYTKLFKRRKFNRHKHNIKKGNYVLNTLKQIEEPYANAKRINYLKKTDPFVFEELLLTCFELKGYKIKRNKRYTGDGGIDGIIYDEEGRKILIQAKRYTGSISSSHVKDLHDLVIKRKAYKGFFIHTGRTPKAVWNSYDNVEIWSGNKLIELVI